MGENGLDEPVIVEITVSTASDRGVPSGVAEGSETLPFPRFPSRWHLKGDPPHRSLGGRGFGPRLGPGLLRTPSPI